MLERQILPVFTFVERIEFRRPLDPDLVLVREFDPPVTSSVLVSLRVIAPNILSTKLDAGLYCGWPDECDQSLNIDDSSKIRKKSISLQVSEVVFGSRLKLDITEIGAAISKLLRGFARIVEHQSLSGRVTKDDRDLSWLAFVWLDLVEHLAIAFSVKTQDSPIID